MLGCKQAVAALLEGVAAVRSSSCGSRIVTWQR
jgi:hypothetical protein